MKNPYFIALIFAANCGILIFLLGFLIMGTKQDESLVLLTIFILQLINTTIFIYFFIYFLRQSERIIPDKEDYESIRNYELIRMIVARMLVKELKEDCLNDFKGVKVQALDHEENIRVLDQKRKADIDAEKMRGEYMKWFE